MPRPLRNRFVHLDLEPDFIDWCRWAVKAKIWPEIIALTFPNDVLIDDRFRGISAERIFNTPPI
jgi:hypothetical protein